MTPDHRHELSLTIVCLFAAVLIVSTMASCEKTAHTRNPTQHTEQCQP